MKTDKWKPTNGSHLCSKHFLEEHLDRTGQIVRLRENAVPTIFDFPEHLQTKRVVRKPPTVRTVKTTEGIFQLFQMECQFQSQTLKRVLKISRMQFVTSPKKLKRKLEESVQAIKNCKKKLKRAYQLNRRLKRKVTSLKTVVDDLREKQLITTNCADILETIFSGVSKQIFQRISNAKEGKGMGAYPGYIKAFAMTLQFYSAKAYEYVRETFDLDLPHQRQIRSWYQGVEGDPGFTKNAFTSQQKAR